MMLLYTRGEITLEGGHKMNDIGSVNVTRIDHIYNGEGATWIVLKDGTLLESTETVQGLTQKINSLLKDR